MLIDYLPILIYMVTAIGLVGVIVLLSELLGKKKHFPSKDLPYECGMDPIGDARSRYTVRFYVIAMFFIVFTLKPSSLSWAVVFKPLGWFGFMEMLGF
jgi:NADH-quinone oxidoreductase subunit A